jgi:addiction module HigA family antidote
MRLVANMDTNLRPARVPRPGSVLRQELGARGWTQVDLARIMGCSGETIGRIIDGQLEITPHIARELAAALGTSAELWLNLEAG